MKKFALGLVLTLVSMCFIPSAYAADGQKLEVEVGFWAGNLQSIFNYEYDNPFSSGKNHQLNGLVIAGRFNVNSRLAIVERVEVNSLRLPEFVYIGSLRKETRNTDYDQKNGKSLWYEGSAAIRISELKNHELLAGLVVDKFNREWNFSGWSSDHKENRTSFGPVLGIQGSKKTGKISFEYSIRGYPRLIRKDSSFSTIEGKRIPAPGMQRFGSSGFELRGVASYPLGERISITGGYQYRRLMTTIGERLSNEDVTLKGWLAGLKYSF